jgi:hypothetical protein
MVKPITKLQRASSKRIKLYRIECFYFLDDITCFKLQYFNIKLNG